MFFAFQVAREIAEKYCTSDPFQLADFLHIQVRHEILPPHIGGFYTKVYEYAYIVINSEKPAAWKRAIAAHELGHAILHEHESGHVFLAYDFATQGKLEREANQFAAALLIGDERPYESETIYDFSKRICVPVEFVRYLQREFFYRIKGG